MTRAVVLLCAAAAVAGAQGRGTIVGRVVMREGAVPLPYSRVAVPELGREQFTDDSGAFRLAGLPPQPITIRVRRLGYTPAEAVLTPRADGFDTMHVALDRIAVRIAAVHVRAHPPCREPGAPSIRRDSLTTFVFSQVRENAEQFRLLSREYPFAYLMRIVRRQVSRQGSESVVGTETARTLSQVPWSYAPGRIVGRYRGRLHFNIPTLLDLADAQFVNHHCFHNGGLVIVDDEPMIQIDVVASERIRAPDVHGSMYLDPISFQIRRTVFRLSKMPDIRGMTDMEVTTDFEEVLPSIPVIRQISSVQRLNARLRGVEIQEAREEQKIVAFSWLERRPGEDTRQKPDR